MGHRRTPANRKSTYYLVAQVAPSVHFSDLLTIAVRRPWSDFGELSRVVVRCRFVLCHSPMSSKEKLNGQRAT